MGTRDRYESITKVVQAFAGERTWRQSELARFVGVETRALRKLLLGLAESGMPLEKQEEHPHVYWSVPRHWFPGGVFFDAEDWEVLVHAVLRISDEGRRQRLLGRLLAGRNRAGASERDFTRLREAVVATPLSVEEHQHLLLLERSLLEGVPVSVRYYSTSSGLLNERTISPQRLITGPHARVVAHCHNNDDLRWFRVDNIQRAHLVADRPLVRADPTDVERFMRNSVDGYYDGAEEEYVFCVRAPASSWVKGNLLPGMRIVEDADPLRIVSHGAAVIVARFIVGLGGDAWTEHVKLRKLVCELAEASNRANRIDG